MRERTKAPLLVVEDSSVVVGVYRRFFERMGLRDVDWASDGSEALSMLGRRTYEAVISDWHMENVSGLQLLQVMKADATMRSTGFVMATVEARASYRAAAWRLGVDRYLVKPFSMETMREALVDVSEKIGVAMDPPFYPPAEENVTTYVWPDARASEIAAGPRSKEDWIGRIESPSMPARAGGVAGLAKVFEDV